MLCRRHAVLIETYWNVNTVIRKDNSNSCCINRNILECKYEPERILFRFTNVLIETYWNVNEKFTTIMTASAVVLIETYWNVNEFSRWFS